MQRHFDLNTKPVCTEDAGPGTGEACTQERSCSDTQNTVADLRRRVIEFRDARDWKQFHNPKDLAIALSIEAAELLELCRFKESSEIVAEASSGRSKEYAHEMADILSYLLTLSDCLEIDLSSALQEKMKINALHYPVELARGRKAKYTELQAEQAADKES